MTPASHDHLNKEESRGGAPGAFPETPAKEQGSFGVNPLPATEGAGNPVDLPAGEKVPPPSEVTSNTIHSSVTTSQGDYEKAGSGMSYLGGALAALGLGGTAAKKENLIPESSLPMGKDAGDSLNAGPLVSSAGAGSTTAEMAGKVPLEEKKPAMEMDSDVQATTSSVPEMVKDSIAEAHTDPEAATSSEAVKEKSEVEQELLKKVPSSDEAGEPAPTIATATSAAAPSATTSGVPAIVKDSIAEAHTEPEAATSSEAVKEKTEVEQELLKKVPSSEEAGEPAPTIAAATSATAPSATTEPSSANAPGTSLTAAAAVADGADDSVEPTAAPKTVHALEKTEGDNTEYAPPMHTGAPGVSASAAAAISDGTEDPTLMDEPAVQMMTQNDTEAAGAPAAESAPAHEATTTEASTATAPTTGASTVTAPTTGASTGAPTVTAPTTEAPTVTAPTTEAPTVTAPAAEAPKATAPTTAAPESKKEEAKAASPAATTSATSTPQKPTSTTPTSTPGSAATKEKKKKNRVSSFFKKIFD